MGMMGQRSFSRRFNAPVADAERQIQQAITYVDDRLVPWARSGAAGALSHLAGQAQLLAARFERRPHTRSQTRAGGRQ